MNRFMNRFLNELSAMQFELGERSQRGRSLRRSERTPTMTT
jgi:hypothetical protein